MNLFRPHQFIVSLPIYSILENDTDKMQRDRCAEGIKLVLDECHSRGVTVQPIIPAEEINQ